MHGVVLVVESAELRYGSLQILDLRALEYMSSCTRIVADVDGFMEERTHQHATRTTTTVP